MRIDELTVDHVLYCFGFVLAEVDNASFGFLERVSACAIEETRTRAYDSSVDGVFSRTTDNLKVRVFASFKKPRGHERLVSFKHTQPRYKCVCTYTRTYICLSITYAANADINSVLGLSIMRGIGMVAE
jgi:hypothetical protein